MAPDTDQMIPLAESIRLRTLHLRGTQLEVSAREIAILDEELSDVLAEIRRRPTFESAQDALDTLGQLESLFALLKFGHRVKITDRQTLLVYSYDRWDDPHVQRDMYDSIQTRQFS